MRRGDIFMADVEAETGVAKTRRVLIVQNDIGNKYSGSTIAAVIRSDAGKRLKIHVPVPSGQGGLTKNSVVDCGILATIPKSKLGRLAGRLPSRYMAQIDEALKISLDLE